MRPPAHEVFFLGSGRGVPGGVFGPGTWLTGVRSHSLHIEAVTLASVRSESSERDNEVSDPSVFAEVTYGGPGIGFLVGTGLSSGAGSIAGSIGPGSATPGTLQQAA